MVVTGGLTWWKDFICVACFNVPEQHDEVRLYVICVVHVTLIFMPLSP